MWQDSNKRQRSLFLSESPVQGNKSEVAMTEPVMAIHDWKSNAELIEDCARLGYLNEHWATLDCTWGYGTFWKNWSPLDLTGCDLDPAKSPIGYSVDFTKMPFADRSFKSVVFDGPYKLNGTDQGEGERYGVHETTRWQDRMQLLRDGITECARVLGDGYLLVKCQSQVCSGKVRWQDIEFVNHAQTCGLGLVDRLDMLSYRPQPEGRSQVHARRNASTMLILKRGWKTSDLKGN